MNRITDNRLILSLSLYLLFFIFCLPFYRYILDVDGIGYIGAAKQYLAGNFKLAVNGYWSPLHSWIIVPFMKAGILPEDAFRYSNALIGVGSIYVLHRLLNKVELTASVKTGILLTAVVILLHYTFYELAADMLLVFLLLILFNLVLSGDFYTNSYYNALAGLTGALAYFAKSYAFPFFILYFVLLHLLFNNSKSKKVYHIFWGLAVFFLISLPWIYLLHWKYGGWMIAYGKNNYGNWGTEFRVLSGQLLVGPPYNGSPSIWEDPWKVYTLSFKHAETSSIVLHQARIIFFNIQQWLKSMHDLTFFSSSILFITFIYYLKEKNRFWLFVLITVFTLSAGYLLLHIETRFIWSLAFLFLIAGSQLLSKLMKEAKIHAWQKAAVWLIFFGSFLAEPVNHLKDHFNANRDLYNTVNTIKKESIHGSFTANTKQDICMVIAYLSNNPYYTVVKPTFTTDEMISELYEKKIRYYFFYYATQQEKEEFLCGKIAAKAKQFRELEPGLLVLDLY